MAEINIEKMAKNVAEKAMQELRDNGVFVSRWIPVSERLPKELDGTVLIMVNGEVRTGQYSEFNNTWYKGDMCGVGGNDPIAWMPLPKPYEKQESEEQE